MFTHLTDNSLPWLYELHRLLKPGGLLIATYMGRWTSELLAGEPWDEDATGMNVLRHNHPAADGAPLVMISDWWLREHWGRAFEVLRDRAQHPQPELGRCCASATSSVSVSELERPGDDPREYAALRHNLLQAQRELETVQSTVSKQLRREYEQSLSWRLTRPLRLARRELARLPGPAPGEVAAGEPQRRRQLPADARGHHLELAPVLGRRGRRSSSASSAPPLA